MQALFSSIAYILGYVLNLLYNSLWFNYGLAIIVFTIILRFILLPLAVKSFKSMAQINEIQPLMTELQRKYKNDKETLNKEVMKIYQEKKINPFGGCLPLLIQLPILYALFLVISQPITYVFQGQDIVNTTAFQKQYPSNNFYRQLEFLNKQSENGKLIKEIKKELTKKYNNPEAANIINEKNINKMNLNFLGVNLGDIPKFFLPEKEKPKYIILWIVALLSGFTTYLSAKYGQPPINKDSEQSQMQKSMQKQMLIMMPLMSTYFSFIVPAGLSLYWIVSNIFQLVQQKVLINKYYIKKKEA